MLATPFITKQFLASSLFYFSHTVVKILYSTYTPKSLQILYFQRGEADNLSFAISQIRKRSSNKKSIRGVVVFRHSEIKAAYFRRETQWISTAYRTFIAI